MTIKTVKTKIRDLKFRLYYITFFKCKTYVRRKITTLLKLHRPTSLPHITGDGFRSIAQHVFDETQTVAPSSVAHGDIIFVRADFLHDYFKTIHPLIQNP
jgi:phosphoribosylaminoimidazole (AIR) synthetase